MCAYRPHPVGRNRPRSLCRAGSRDDRGGRRAGAFGYGTDGFQQGRRIGDGARKRDEPCRDHRPEQGHRGAGRRCRVHAAGQNRRPADNRRGAGRTDRRPRSGYRTQIRRAARIAAPGCVPLRGGCTGARRHARRAADHGAGQCRERRRSATRARCTKYQDLRDALEKLQLNDAALQFEPETSIALGFGFRCGFLGLLHLEIIQERLEREYNLDLVTTAPGVIYKVHKTNGDVIDLTNPSNMPDPSEIDYMEEPMVSAEIMVTTEFVGPIMKLCQERRGIYNGMEYIEQTRALLKYDLPLAIAQR